MQGGVSGEDGIAFYQRVANQIATGSAVEVEPPTDLIDLFAGKPSVVQGPSQSLSCRTADSPIVSLAGTGNWMICAIWILLSESLEPIFIPIYIISRPMAIPNTFPVR